MMNQEQNSLNPNNFNTQGNNGIPNNQPLNNQNFNQGMSFNQQPINPQPQHSHSYEQPITQQPMSSRFESGNSNNQSFNSKPPKKMNLGLIIGIVAVVAVVGFGVIFGSKLLSNNGNNDNSNNSSNSNGNINNSSEIKQLQVEFDRVVALTSDGNMYVVQDQAYSDYYGKDVPSKIDTPKLIAENVKQFFTDGTAYIDSDNNLYRAGLNPIKGGMFDKYVKLGQNIKNVDDGGLGLLATTNDGQLYIYGKSDFYAGSEENETSLTKINTSSNNVVDSAQIYSSWTVYLTSDGELFVRGYGEEEFVKKESNISKMYHQYYNNRDNVYFEKNDGKTYEVDYYGKEFTLKEVSDSKPKSYPSDVKTLIYDSYNFISDSGTKSTDVYVYINNSNKVVIYANTTETLGYENGMPKTKTTEEKKELNLSIDNMNTILTFIKKYQY